MIAPIWTAYLGTSNPVALPLATLTVNLRNASPSYHAISVPYAATLTESLASRPTDTVRIYRAGVEWGYFNRDRDAVYQGAQSSTITLSGYRQQTYATPATVTLSRKDVGLMRTLSDGSVVAEIHPASDVYPLDTVIVGTIAYTATKVDYLISPARGRVRITMTEV